LNKLPSFSTTGEITKKRGGGFYHVKLEDGRQIYCSLVKRFKIVGKRGNRSARVSDIIVGDKVKIEIQLRDKDKGSIVGYA
jgi:translation initiation factor IF-1